MKQLLKIHSRKMYFLLLPLSFFLITACPFPPENTDCGKNQIKVNDECECAVGYHWNEDLTKCLMDTTSHNFVWEIDTLGIYPSYLYDVAVINENNIWVVGMIKTDEPDTVYNLPYTTYNAAQWDGSEWELIEIISNVEKKAIFAFEENDLWAASTLPMHYNGSDWYMFTPQDDNYPSGLGWINAIWGTSSSNIYFIGNNGSIVHYDGSNFTLMESGTDVDLLDIHGSADGVYVFTTGFNLSGEHAGQTVALELIDNEWQTLYSYHTTWSENDSTGGVYACYVYGDTVYFNRTGGFWKFNYLTRESTIIPPENTGGLSNFAWRKIIVANTNDMYFMANGFSYLHFNGDNWFVDHSVNTYLLSECVSNNFDYADNTITMVGYITLGKGIVVFGRRK